MYNIKEHRGSGGREGEKRMQRFVERERLRGGGGGRQRIEEKERTERRRASNKGEGGGGSTERGV